MHSKIYLKEQQLFFLFHFQTIISIPKEVYDQLTPEKIAVVVNNKSDSNNWFMFIGSGHY